MSSRLSGFGRQQALRRSHCRRGGFTLLEVLIATAITLLMMLSLVQVFKVIGDSMKQGRAALQMNNTLRAVTFRLRNDLSNLTVRVDPPADQGSGGGYLEYFDGLMTDYTAGLFVGAGANRFGDCDDILMFTARAGDSWFTGQVPERVLDPLVGINPPNTSTTPVTITSQLAEIAVFARPVNSSGVVGHFDDIDNNGFPDAYQLHYRVLLIRPDLNLNTTGGVPHINNFATQSAADLPISMADAFQVCDLSMHRVYDGNASTADAIAANSLEDLSISSNRFAHFQYPAPGTNGSCTMPLLVLDPIPSVGVSPATPLTAFNSGMYVPSNPATMPAPLLGSAGNFLHPAYVLGGLRQGEDILASNVLAFDVKGYDEGAPLIGLPGNDGSFGTKLANGNFNGNFGEDGTDDILLSPNDPGFAAGFANASVTSVGFGEYVDLMWAVKSLNTLPMASPALDFRNVYAKSNSGAYFMSGLSGLEGTLSNVAVPPLTYGGGLVRSGKYVNNPSVPYTIVQPTFDTWTTNWESNGTRQAPLGFTGTLDVNAYQRLKDSTAGTDSTGPNTDTGTDGIDNNGTGGVDEAAERETLPPFPVKLRGIKISVRIEDIATRQVKQMSVANEFVTQ